MKIKYYKNKIVEDYYDTIKDKYPELNFLQVQEMCYTPFRMLKELWKKSCLEEVRFKYFGTFRISNARLKAEYKYIGSELERGIITEEEYLTKKKDIELFFKQNNIDYVHIDYNPID